MRSLNISIRNGENKKEKQKNSLFNKENNIDEPDKVAFDSKKSSVAVLELGQDVPEQLQQQHRPLGSRFPPSNRFCMQFVNVCNVYVCMHA